MGGELYVVLNQLVGRKVKEKSLDNSAEWAISEQKCAFLTCEGAVSGRFGAAGIRWILAVCTEVGAARLARWVIVERR
jgi:hypothetical protein